MSAYVSLICCIYLNGFTLFSRFICRFSHLTGQLFRCLAFPFLFSLSCLANADVYKWTDSDGKVHFSDSRSNHYDSEEVAVQRANTVEHVSKPQSKNARFNPEHVKSDVVMVTIFISQNCDVCDAAIGFLEAEGIDYQKADIDQSQVYYNAYKRLGGEGLPLLIFDEHAMTGFHPDLFLTLYYGKK